MGGSSKYDAHGRVTSYAYEVMIFVSSVGILMFTPASTQYIQMRKCQELHNGEDCDSDEVTSAASQLLLYFSLCSSIPALFTVTIFGIISDRYGRKPTTILGLFVNLTVAVAYLVVSYWDLSLTYLYLGYILNGVGGGFSLLLMTAFASTADRCAESERTWRVSLMEGCVITGGTVGSIATGQLLKHWSYPGCFLVMVALVFVAVLIVLLFVDESLQKKHRRESVSFQDANFIGVLRVVANNKVLPLLLFGFFINVTIYIGPASASILFFKQRFHWSPARIGFYSALKAACQGLGLIFLLPLASRCFKQKHDWSIAMIATVIFATYSALTGLVNDSDVVFALSGISFASLWATPIMRAFMSRHSSPSEQGAVFSAIAAVETCTPLAGSFLFTELYSKTAKSTPWLFLMMVPAGCACVMIILIAYKYLLASHGGYHSENGYEKLPQNDGVIQDAS